MTLWKDISILEVKHNFTQLALSYINLEAITTKSLVLRVVVDSSRRDENGCRHGCGTIFYKVRNQNGMILCIAYTSTKTLLYMRHPKYMCQPHYLR